MSITRYHVWHEGGGLDYCEESERGNWVIYEDHTSEVKALQEEIALLKSKLNFDWDSIK